MAAYYEMNKNSGCNVNCSLCAKFIKILQHEPEHSMKLKCDKCNDNPLVALCVCCKSYLCQNCHTTHSKAHKILSLNSIAKEKAAGHLAGNIVYCPEHQTKELEYYCQTCDRLVCLNCTMKDHVGHKFEIAKKSASECRSVLMKFTTPLAEMGKILSKAEANIITTQEKIKEQASEIDQKIDKSYEEQLQKLNEHHKQLKKELRDAASHKERALKEQLQDVMVLQDDVVGIKELCEGLVKTPDHNILSTKIQDVEMHMQKVSEQYRNLNTEPVEYDNFEFVPVKPYSFLLGELFTFANPHTSETVNCPSVAYCGYRMEFEIIAKDSKSNNCTKGGSQVSVQLKSFTGDVTAGEVRDNNDGSYMASFVAEQVGEAKLSVAINEEQIKGSPYSIVVGRNYQAIDKPSKIVNNDGSMVGPWGVAFGMNGLWAVADNSNHCVSVFNDKDQLVRKFGSNGSNNGQFSYPHGVAFDSHNHLYVTDNGNHRVQKFNSSGNFLLQFGSKGVSDGQINNPQGLVIHNTKVYIADCDNKRVSVFQTNGKFCFSFGSDWLGCPQDVAVNSSNHLLVADSRNSCICIFTLDGHYVGKHDTQGSASTQLKNPYSITTDLNGFIIVADACNQGVLVFDKGGDYIYSFGSYGSASGQFKSPYGIALNPSGSIYVSDFYNKRIQIFSSF